jgi:hypothetical protein
LGDVHLPFTRWDVLEAAAKDCKAYKPDLIVQIGDLLDQYNWSLYKRATYAPNAEEEWHNTEQDIHHFHKLFGDKVPMEIVMGNHDLRLMLRCMEANLPRKLIRQLDELFPFDNWNWRVEQKPLIRDGVLFCHGDETGGDAFEKAQVLGTNVIQGHDHKGYLRYASPLEINRFGMSVGCFIDNKSVAAAYARRNFKKGFLGWATCTDGVPQLFPFRG